MIKFNIKRMCNFPMLFLLLGIVLELVGVIVYTLTGVDEFNETLSPMVNLFAYIAIGLGAALIVVRILSLDDVKFVKCIYDVLITICYILAVFTFVYYIAFEVNYLANVFVAIDGTKISAKFVITVGLYLFSFVLFLLASIRYSKIKNESEEVVHEN